MAKTMFEKFEDKELPQKLLNALEYKAKNAKSEKERYFIIGYFVAIMSDEYRTENGEIVL